MRAAKVFVLASTLLALAAQAWLVSATHPWLWWVVALAFGASVAISRASLTFGLACPLLLAYTAPALVMLATGSTEYQLIVVWLAVLAGPIVAGSDWRRWHTPERWTIALVAWAVILAITWPVIALREIDWSLIAARTLDTPNGIYAPAPPLSAGSVVLAALGQLLGLLWLDFLWTRFGARELARAERVVVLPLVASIALGCTVAVGQKTIDIGWLSTEPWPRLDRAAGLMLDANSFGTAAAMWAPLALAAAWRLGLPTAAGAAVTALVAAGMWTSGSRTALLVAVVGVTAISTAVLWRSRSWQTRYAPLALLLAAAIVVVGFTFRGSDESSPLARLMDTIPSAAEGGVPQLARDLWDRNGYGVAAARAIAEHPWTGLGTGAFTLLSPEYFHLETGGLIPGDNAQNWWRHQIVELGILGAIPALAVSIGILAMLVIGTPTAGNRAVTTLLRGTLTGVGLASLVGVGTQHPALFLTFMTIVFWLGALVGRPAPPEPPRAWWLAALVLAVVVVAGQAMSAVGALRVPHRAVTHGFGYGYGFSAPQADPVRGQVRRTASHAVGVIPAEHAYFHVTLVAPQASAGEPVQIRLWRGRDLIVDQRVSGQEPIVRYIGVRPGEQRLMIEVDVSRTADDGTGVTLAGTWVRALPDGIHPGVVAQ